MNPYAERDYRTAARQLVGLIVSHQPRELTAREVQEFLGWDKAFFNWTVRYTRQKLAGRRHALVIDRWPAGRGPWRVAVTTDEARITAWKVQQWDYVIARLRTTRVNTRNGTPDMADLLIENAAGYLEAALEIVNGTRT